MFHFMLLVYEFKFDTDDFYSFQFCLNLLKKKKYAKRACLET